jgi:endonuclease YncB( thermonuclease family)
MSFKKPFRAVPITLGKRYRARARRERLAGLAVPFAIVIGAAGIGAFTTGVLPAASETRSAAGEEVFGCRVTDGDTIRCGIERIRLLAIDAPELPGHCRTGRDCAPGDPYASSDSLGAGLIGTIRIERFGTDRYGRTLGSLSGDKGNLSCWQLDRRQAIYKPAWDNQLKIARTCPQSII